MVRRKEPRNQQSFPRSRVDGTAADADGWVPRGGVRAAAAADAADFAVLFIFEGFRQFFFLSNGERD